MIRRPPRSTRTDTLVPYSTLGRSIAGLPGPERDADLAVSLKTADSWSVPGARIDDNKRALLAVYDDTFRWHDPREDVVDRPLQGASVDDKLRVKGQDVRGTLGQMLQILVASLSKHVQAQNVTLPGIGRVRHAGSPRPASGRGR